MSSVQNGIIYLALAAIIYFIIKAFTNSKTCTNLDNKHILVIVLIIMCLVIFIINQNKKVACKTKIEPYVACSNPDPFYQTIPILNPTSNSADCIDKANPQNSADCLVNDNDDDITWQDEDVKDFADIMGIDKKKYRDIIRRENAAKKKIRDNYRDEMVYTESNPLNTVPVGTDLYGYTYLPPENWFRAYDKPPVCITENRSPITSLLDKNTAHLLEFETCDNARPPLGLNINYIKKILNKNKGT